MYYEARTHELAEVADAMAAATMIKSRNMMYEYTCLQFKAEDKTLVIVPDAHINNPWFEVAVLLKTDDGYTQIESITAGWCDSPEELAGYFTKAAETGYNMGKARIIFGKPKGDETAWFECGCCGNGFKGNVAFQQKFDQDMGIGICKSCEHFYS